MADELLGRIRDGGPFGYLPTVVPGLGLRFVPGSSIGGNLLVSRGQEPGTIYVNVLSSRGSMDFSYEAGVPCPELEEELERWVPEAAAEMARFVTDALADALMAGATQDDLASAVANALASTVMGT